MSHHDRAYWDEHAKNYDRTMYLLGRPIPRMVELAGETALSWVVSRALAVTGFPGHRRFTARSLRQAVEEAGVRVTRTETLPGLIPIGYVEGTSGPR